MTKLTKNQKLAFDKLERNKLNTLAEGSSLVKEITKTKFDASIDLDVRLGIDPRKSNQMVRGVVSLPHGTGKVTRVLVLCSPDKEAEAKSGGADHVGLDDYIEKIKVTGNDKTRDNVIRRQLTFYPGEKLDTEKIRDSQRRLSPSAGPSKRSMTRGTS